MPTILARIGLACTITLLTSASAIADTFQGGCNKYFEKNNIAYRKLPDKVERFASAPGSDNILPCQRVYQVWANVGQAEKCGDTIFDTDFNHIYDKSGNSFRLASHYHDVKHQCSIEGARALETTESKDTMSIEGSSLKVKTLWRRTELYVFVTPNF